MARLNGICVVAHPDDCIIFARPFILFSTDVNWHIVYMTYRKTDPRAIEISNYWNNKKITTEFLGYEDNYQDNSPSGYLKFWYGTNVRFDILKKIADADIVLTHNPDGDYGHYHHKIVSDTVRFSGKPAVFFSKHTQANMKLTTADSIDYDQIPLHADIVRQFENINTKWYIITPAAKEILNGKA